MMNEKEFQQETELEVLTEDLIENQEEVTEEPEEIVEEKQKKTPQQSWKELRDKAELADKYQRERDEYLGMLRNIEEQAYALQRQKNESSYGNKQEDEDTGLDYNNLPDDELLTGKDIKKVLLKEQSKIKKMQEEMLRNQRVSQENALEAQLKSQYSDFYDVVNSENIQKLRNQRPGLARSLHLNPDLKEKAEETYFAIKDLGIYKNNDYEADKDIVKKNLSKPRSVNSVAPQFGESPLNKANAFANGLTKELKQSLYEDMLKKAKGY